MKLKFSLKNKEIDFDADVEGIVEKSLNYKKEKPIRKTRYQIKQEEKRKNKEQAFEYIKCLKETERREKLMEKKKALILCGIVGVVCAIAITIGVLTENKNTQPEEPNTQIDNTIKENPDNTEPTETQIYTVDNCEDFAKLLESNSADVIKSFVEMYEGKEIMFDGHIALVNNHDDYDTRYDILIYAGDYTETGAGGPSFKFEDVNTNDLGIKDLYLPDFVSSGNNIRITAEVDEYDDVAGVLKLDPILVESR